MATTYEKIQSTTLGSASNNITFSSIPATYTDLRVVISGLLTGADQPYLRFNADSSSLYSQTSLYGNGTTASSASLTAQNRIYFDQVSNFSSTIPFFTSIDVFSYAGSTNKTCLLTTSFDANGSGEVHRIAGLYRSTTAISQLELRATNLATGVIATLYGILKA